MYQGALEKAKASCSVVPYFTKEGTFSPPPPGSKRPPNSAPISAHYRFDMTQQVFCPNNPLQPGPMYLLTPRKCAIFGVCCDSIPRMTTYLIDEAVDMGKDPNAIVSMLHHFFENHGLGEERVHPHADNCGGQNKNRYYDAVPSVESDDRPAQGDHALIHDSRPHKVQHRLVLRTPEKKVQEDRSRWSSGLGRGRE